MLIFNPSQSLIQNLKDIGKEQKSDSICSTIINYCQNGWSPKDKIKNAIIPYLNKQGELSVCGGILLLGTRIFTPKKLHHSILEKVHEGHQGISRCCLRAKTAVWWPGMQKDIINVVKQCNTCAKNPQAREPLLTTTLLSYPWQRVATDLFVFRNINYLKVVFITIKLGNIITATTVISALKSILSQLGIQETVVTDNGPQYTSQEFREFSLSYYFSHVTSSPYYLQSNGLVERGLRTVKQLIANSSDIYIALLYYRQHHYHGAIYLVQNY